MMSILLLIAMAAVATLAESPEGTELTLPAHTGSGICSVTHNRWGSLRGTFNTSFADNLHQRMDLMVKKAFIKIYSSVVIKGEMVYKFKPDGSCKQKVKVDGALSFGGPDAPPPLRSTGKSCRFSGVTGTLFNGTKDYDHAKMQVCWDEEGQRVAMVVMHDPDPDTKRLILGFNEFVQVERKPVVETPSECDGFATETVAFREEAALGGLLEGEEDVLAGAETEGDDQMLLIAVIVGVVLVIVGVCGVALACILRGRGSNGQSARGSMKATSYRMSGVTTSERTVPRTSRRYRGNTRTSRMSTTRAMRY